MRSIYLLPLVLLACGDNHDHEHPDAPVHVQMDAPPDSPPVECHYTEMSDATNDDLLGSGTAEATSLSFTGDELRICGVTNNGHFNSAQQNVDVDVYTLTVPATKLGILYLDAGDAAALDSISLEISGVTTATYVDELSPVADNFAVNAATLVPGDYKITVAAYNATDPASSTPYKLFLKLDDASRCAHATGTVTYPETIDGATASGNDVYEVRYSGSPKRQFTALGTDTPEPTNITVAASGSSRITGTSESPATAPVSWMDSFQDRDTYELTMGATTNLLSVRINWASTTVDYDFFVFPMGQLGDISRGWQTGKMEDEFATVAVTPGSKYDVWVGALDGSTGFPSNYDVTVCGGSYMPTLPRLGGPRVHVPRDFARHQTPLAKH